MEEQRERIDKALLKFINEENNYYKGELSIGREPVPGSSKAFYILKYKDMTLFTFWYSYETKPPKKVGGARHTTGGKKPYAKLMLDKLDDYDLSRDEASTLLLLANSVEWGTGKIINKRSKKALQAEEIQKKVKLSRNKFYATARSLKEKELITTEDGCYFISPELLKKG